MFDIIVAMNFDSLIGVKECDIHGLPWPNISPDMKRFREMTSTCPEGTYNSIIVGYNTYHTLPRTFANKTRKVIVVDREVSFSDALKQAEGANKIYVIGGAAVYAQALNHGGLKTIHCTLICNKWDRGNLIEKGIFFPVSFEKLGHTTDKSATYDKATGTYVHFYTISPKEKYVLENLVTLPPQPVEEDQYSRLVRKILAEGTMAETRNGKVLSIFGHQMRYDLSEGYPINTMKRSYPKAIFEELMWMIRGQTDADILRAKNVNIWNANSSKEYLMTRGLDYEEGDIGPGYGFQMRHWGETYSGKNQTYGGIDQLGNIIDAIKNNKADRRMIINLWNVADLDKMALPPCHMVYHFVVNGDKLDCHLFQRSWDVMLGWNTSTAALFTYIVANHCGLKPGTLVHSISDCHIYKTHINAAKEMIEKRHCRKLPKLTINEKRENIEDYEYSDVTLKGYCPCPPIKVIMVA